MGENAKEEVENGIELVGNGKMCFGTRRKVVLSVKVPAVLTIQFNDKIDLPLQNKD
jgi:hypothetical protein